MLESISNMLIANAERRLGVRLDYVRAIAAAGTGLLIRYNRIFGFLDPNRHAPSSAYHLARLRGAIAADCGTCVEAEFNLARNAGVDGRIIQAALRDDADALEPELAAVVRMADAVVAQRTDDAEAREEIVMAYGDKGLIELAMAMNGAALLPGMKRAMGHAVACDATGMQRLITASGPDGSRQNGRR